MSDDSTPPLKRAKLDVPETPKRSDPHAIQQILDGDLQCGVVFETCYILAALAPSPASHGHCLLIHKHKLCSTVGQSSFNNQLETELPALTQALTQATSAAEVQVIKCADLGGQTEPQEYVYYDVIPMGTPQGDLAADQGISLLANLRSHLPPSYRCFPFCQAGPEPGAISIRLEDSQDTSALGALLSQLAAPGEVFALLGDLGAGKTCVARGFIREFFSAPDLHVPSPTYLLCLTYADEKAANDEGLESCHSSAGHARIPGTTIYHMDPYRLKQEGKMAALVDFKTAFADHICLIEWPQRLGTQLYNKTSPGRLEIEFQGTGPQAQGRQAVLRATSSPKWANLLQQWQAEGRLTAPVSEAIPSDQAHSNAKQPSQVAAANPRGLSALPGDPKTWKILGIETSCDDTGAAVVCGDGQVLSDILASQAGIHEQYGGVKPDAAQAAHQENIDWSVEEALRRANVKPEDLTAVAVTVGPGLALCLEVGVKKALSIAGQHHLPIVPVHHMEAHAMVTKLPDPATLAPSKVQFPALILLVSGGHNMLVLSHGLGRHRIIGNTLDDSIGEAFDKTARLLGIDAIPGGPQLEKMAKKGNPLAYMKQLPMPLSKAHKTSSMSCDFSYAGLKSAVRDLVKVETQRIKGQHAEEELDAILQQTYCDIAASFQAVAIRHLAQRMERAIQWVTAMEPAVQTVVVAGGVAANEEVRNQLAEVVSRAGLTLVCPPIRLCTDNGVMVAWTGLERLKLGLYDDPPIKGPAGYSAEVRPRWPLGERDIRSAPAPGGRYG